MWEKADSGVSKGSFTYYVINFWRILKPLRNQVYTSGICYNSI